MSKVVEVRYDRFLELGPGRADPLGACRRVTGAGSTRRRRATPGARRSCSARSASTATSPRRRPAGRRHPQHGLALAPSSGGRSGCSPASARRTAARSRRSWTGTGSRSSRREELVAPGRSSSIDIEIQPDRQPWMDNFVPGVWDDYRLTPRERDVLRARGASTSCSSRARSPSSTGSPPTARSTDRAVSADFLGFRHYTVERLAQTMAPRRPRVHRLARRRGRTRGRGHARGRERPRPRARRDDGRARGPRLRRRRRWHRSAAIRCRPWRSRARRSAAATRSSRGSSTSCGAPATSTPRSRGA